MDFDIITSAGVIFISFYRAYKNPDCIKTAYEAHYNKNRSGDNGKKFLEYPDERAKTDKQ